MQLRRVILQSCTCHRISRPATHSRAYDLLLKEAELIRRDASKLPLSPRRRTRRTKRRTPVRQRKRDLTAKAASAPTQSLLNAESFLANFVLPDPPLPPAGEAKEAAAANVNTPTPTTRDSPPQVPQITGTPHELVFREQVRNTPDQGESDGTNPSSSSAPSSPSTSCDVSAIQPISVAPANATVQGASSPRRSDPSPSQPRGKGKEGTACFDKHERGRAGGMTATDGHGRVTHFRRNAKQRLWSVPVKATLASSEQCTGGRV
ncbi:hypothetical protein HPB50_025326 [Hyalomma asiaticum]|uniref:Uncharacterized protein n=1 Tax=Hyalomma asiaticum TaxID=266040 RepID=A0ACB7SV89_HYAAI|nr:hypothetical protein HPB50_025326 [Hyalomma asiaticum]